MTSIIDDLKAVLEQLRAARPVLYYATSEAVIRGKALQFKEQQEPFPSPEWYLLHPDDWPEIQRQTEAHVQWRHLHEWQPDPPIRYGPRSWDVWEVGRGWRPKR